MKIYFTGSISGGRSNVGIYQQIVEHIRKYGIILTEHVADPNLTARGENLPAKKIHDRDVDWVKESDVFIAEVSTPSLGVGYEIRIAIEHKKPVLCLYKSQQDRLLSAMIRGNSEVLVKEYNSFEDAIKIIDEFFATIAN